MASDNGTPDVGRRLSSARLRRGLSQGVVARRAGIAPSYLSRIETGKVQPTFRTVVRIAAALKVTPEEILGHGTLAGGRDGGCPVTAGGACLLDLMRPEHESAPAGAQESYTPRQVRLLRLMVRWMQTAPRDGLRAMEVLLDELARASSPGASPAAAKVGRGRPPRRVGSSDR